MPALFNIAPTPVFDTLLAVTLTLLLGRLILLFVTQPVIRRHVCICTLLGCLIAAPTAALPGLPRLKLKLVADTALLLNNPRADVGLIPGDLPAAGKSTALKTPAQPVPTSTLAAWINPATVWRALIALYLAGASVMLARLLLGIILVHRYIRTAEPASGVILAHWRRLSPHSRVALKVSSQLPRPVTAGILRPTVLIPESLCRAADADTLEAVLLHELGHTRRRDTLACLLASLTHALLFFHPLVWWTARDLRRAQEMLADAWAAAAMGDVELYVARFLELSRAAQWSARIMMPVAEAFRRHGEFYHRMKYVLLHGQQVQTRCRRGVALTAVLIILGTLTASFLSLGGKSHPDSESPIVALAPIEARGIEFLLAHQQPNGGWLTSTGPGVTAMVVKSLLHAGHTPESPAVAHALAYIESTQQPDGGFYSAAYPSYNTAIVVSTLAMLPDERYQKRVERAHDFIAMMRRANARPAAASQQDAFYQADAEVEAFHSLGKPGNDPALRAAITQMSQLAAITGERADSQRLPRYGAMTYAELKSLLYAGLSRDDPRVRGVLACIQEYYTLDQNPGDGSSRGQFYFYHAMAKAMRAYGDDVIIDARGQLHDWKQELSGKLATLQQPDGSWVNTQAHDYLENNPVLVTTYCVLALQEMR